MLRYACLDDGIAVICRLIVHVSAAHSRSVTSSSQREMMFNRYATGYWNGDLLFGCAAREPCARKSPGNALMQLGLPAAISRGDPGRVMRALRRRSATPTAEGAREEQFPNPSSRPRRDPAAGTSPPNSTTRTQTTSTSAHTRPRGHFSIGNHLTIKDLARSLVQSICLSLPLHQLLNQTRSILDSAP